VNNAYHSFLTSRLHGNQQASQRMTPKPGLLKVTMTLFQISCSTRSVPQKKNFWSSAKKKVMPKCILMKALWYQLIRCSSTITCSYYSALLQLFLSQQEDFWRNCRALEVFLWLF